VWLRFFVGWVFCFVAFVLCALLLWVVTACVSSSVGRCCVVVGVFYVCVVYGCVCCMVVVDVWTDVFVCCIVFSFCFYYGG